MPLPSRAVSRSVAFAFAAAVAGIVTSAHDASARAHRPDPNALRNVPIAALAPDFAFDLDGRTHHLRDLAGRPVVLSFWATWCRPCQDELPAFVRVRDTYGDRVTLLTVSFEDPQTVRAFLHEQNIALPVIDDEEKTIFTQYSVTPIPVTLVLDQGERVRHISVGEIDWPELSSAIDAVLPVPAAPSSSAAPSAQPAPSPTDHA